ncbi:hypothetical protein BU26DRAFT_560982 [Trematosphaeria pertusa]|uniref:Uncharacterized protein n=1 Tax=Trematosphaeria pertusa TaxID=390896 RepID=A0A6A6IVQ5_9PLEO|nr:uncharacterized protein BU26DRAFT_560982 [Trematosphaeria pertusa]KAF2253700.1 hypothetical protein BU26DRAFT_560982 [Trematosphaeria pertusa]
MSAQGNNAPLVNRPSTAADQIGHSRPFTPDAAFRIPRNMNEGDTYGGAGGIPQQIEEVYQVKFDAIGNRYVSRELPFVPSQAEINNFLALEAEAETQRLMCDNLPFMPSSSPGRLVDNHNLIPDMTAPPLFTDGILDPNCNLREHMLSTNAPERLFGQDIALFDTGNASFSEARDIVSATPDSSNYTESGSDGEEPGSKMAKTNKNGAPRKPRAPRAPLLKWNAEDYIKGLFGIVFACGELGIQIPFDMAAQVVSDTCSGGALQQALLKQRVKMNNDGYQIPTLKMSWTRKGDKSAKGSDKVNLNSKPKATGGLRTTLPRRKPTKRASHGSFIITLKLAYKEDARWMFPAPYTLQFGIIDLPELLSSIQQVQALGSTGTFDASLSSLGQGFQNPHSPGNPYASASTVSATAGTNAGVYTSLTQGPSNIVTHGHNIGTATQAGLGNGIFGGHPYTSAQQQAPPTAHALNGWGAAPSLQWQNPGQSQNTPYGHGSNVTSHGRGGYNNNFTGHGRGGYN